MGSKTAINYELLSSVGDIANALSVTTLTIHNYLKSGYFPNAFQLPTGVWRIPVSDLDALRKRPAKAV